MTVEYTTVIHKFADQGEKTGWTYIDVPADIAQELCPGNKKSFRVKGRLDFLEISGVALLPMGEGNFILAVNADMRKGMGKSAGATVNVKLDVHHDYSVPAPPELLECLSEDDEAMHFYESLARSHRDYFLKWIESAKTEPTRQKRIVQMVNAMINKWDYPTMIRENRKSRIF